MRHHAGGDLRREAQPLGLLRRRTRGLPAVRRTAGPAGSRHPRGIAARCRHGRADLCHIAHDCPLGTADGWLRAVVAPVLAGPDFRQGRLVVVITADEDDRSDDNRVLTVVASAGMPAHQVVSTPLTHLSLSRLYAEVLHLTPLRGAAGAPSLAQAFHLGVTGG